MTATYAFFVVLAAIVLIACWTDLRERRIPNWLVAVNLAIGLAFVWHGAGWVGVGLAVGHVVIALIVGMVLNAVGAVGAGDAKFYASMAAWLPLWEGLGLLVSVALAGLVLLLAFIVWRRFRPRKPSPENPDFAKLPYGVAIGIGAFVAIVMS